MEHLSSVMEQRNQEQATDDTMEKRQSARALQQRIQPKRDISDAASWTGHNVCSQK